jgi:cytochrome P450
MRRVEDRSEALTREDKRYEEIFSVEKEAADAGHALIDDPYPMFAALRAQSPVFMGSLVEKITGHKDPQHTLRPHCTTLTFDGCSEALANNDLYSSLAYHEQPAIMDTIGHTILTMVGQEHTRYRASIQPVVTRQQAMGWWRERWIEPFVDTLVSEFENNGSADLSLQLCARLPMHTVTAAYGLNNDEALEFRENLIRSMLPSLTPEERSAANVLVRRVLLNAVAERRRERRDDLISRLIDAPLADAEGKPSHLDDEAILSFSRLLLLAGGGTTFRQLGITLFALLSNRDQLEDLRADRSLMEAAIKESLRWNCTDPLFYRLAMRDSVLEGVEIPEGTIVDICLGAGNRDPRHWDDPDRYDLHRPRKRHLGFASGPHICLGRHVAEAEMTAAINALLERLPKLRLDDSGEPARIIGGIQARGVNHLRVRFD